VSTVDRALNAAPRSAFPRLERLRPLLPAVLVAAVLASALAAQLATFGGNLTGFVEFGGQSAHFTRAPAGALFPSISGYDGQYFYMQATDPLLLHRSTVTLMADGGAGFRMQRGAYPALAAALALGHRSALPFMLLAINVLTLLAVAVGLALYARRRGWPARWTLAVALTPGLFLPVVRDLSDPMATAGVLAGLLCWQARRRWLASVCLVVAVLAREAMMLAVVAVLLDAAVQAGRQGRHPRAWLAIAKRAWPVVVLPSLAIVAWRLYINARAGGSVGYAAGGVPVANLLQELKWSFAGEPRMALFDCLYVGLVLAAVVRTAQLLRRELTLFGLAAALLSLSVLLPRLGDVWADTRLSGAMFAVLVIAGLQQRDLIALRIAGAAAALTVPILLISL
jgi:hypothetical protein